MHQVLDGKGELTVDGKSCIVGPGEVFFLYPDIPHAYTPLSRQWQVAWVSFNGREAGQMLKHAGIVESGTGRLGDNRLLYALERMLELAAEDEQTANRERSKQLYGLLIDLKHLLVSPFHADMDIDRLKPVLYYIEHRLHDPLSLNDLAGIIDVSPQYLCRVFQQTLRMRPIEYVNQQRVNRSKQLMFRDPDRKMYEIAKLVGFENASYFCSVFRRRTGMTPDAFKKLHGLGRQVTME